MNLHCYKYRFPLKARHQNSRKTFKKREGFILEYSSGNAHFWGEAAPLPGYSIESLADVENFLTIHKKEIHSALEAKGPIYSIQHFFERFEDLPYSVQFGLDSLAYQLEAYEEKKSLKRYLFPDALNKIPVNALLSLHSQDLLTTIKKRVANGFETIKFKVGIEFKQEYKQLQKIRSEFPNLKIRLDANQAWSLKETLEHCSQLSALNIEFCEEPLREVSPENFEILSQHCNIPFALDESIINCSYWPNLLPFTSYIILKPMFLGDFTTIFETKRLADTHDNKSVFTTSLESSVGRQITAILASGWGTIDTAHGLATGSLLERDVHSESMYIKDGYMYFKLSDHSLGIDPRQLEQVSKRIF